MTVIRGCLAAVIRRFGKYRNVNLVGRFGMYSPNAPCKGCARLADPESAVAPIAACAVDFVASKTALLPSNDLVRSMEDGHRRPRRYAACNNQTFRVFISPAPLNGHGRGPLPADPGSRYACWRAAFCRYWAGRDRR